jgi:uncharacterized protein (UPF0371 family)
MEKIMRDAMPYRSPTEMGVNRAGFAIVDDQVVQEAALQELIRRYFRYKYENILGLEPEFTVQKVVLLMEEVKIRPEDRKVVLPARQAAAEPKQEAKSAPEVSCGAALELKDGAIVTGKNSSLMTAASALALNAIKKLAGIPDQIHLLSPHIIENVANLKRDILHLRREILDLEETLIALSISSATNPTAELAREKLKELADCDVHLTYVPMPGDETGLRSLRVNLTTDGNFPTRDLFMG